MILDIEQTYDKIKISYFDKNGNTKIKPFLIGENKFPKWTICSEMDRDKSTEFTNWDGKAVKQKTDKRFNKFGIYEFIEKLSPEDKEEITAKHLPKVYSIDIETEVIDNFPNPAVARERITTIAISTADIRESKKEFNVLVIGWKDLSIEQKGDIQEKINDYLKDQHLPQDFKFKYIKFADEYNMLYTFMNQLLPKFSLSVGWNFMGFDWPYLFNRSKKLGINPQNISPSKKLHGNDNIPMHIGMMDYMEIYKRWDRTVEVRENNSLDYVSGQVLGVKKIKYDGSLQDLFDNNFEKYVLYNAIDAILVSLIHNKLKTINDVLSVAGYCNLNIYKASSAVNLTEALLWKRFYADNKVIADERSFDVEKGSYEGAYVKEPKPGLYRGVSCYDFASLYPSVMRQINISPESYIKKVKLNTPEIEKYKNDDSVIVGVNGAVYKKEESVLNKILTELYNKRKFHKHESLNINKKLVEYEEKLKNWKD